MARTSREVVFVDGVRTPFGKAGSLYAETRADDLVVNCIRELMRRHPQLPPERVDEVAIAATSQTGDQGLTIGRSAALLAGLPQTVPGFAIDRMCAGAMTAVTTTASGIAFGAYDVAVAGGVEHMGHHPMGQGIDPNPRIVAEKLVDQSALVMGATAENLHDRFPHITRERADAFAAAISAETPLPDRTALAALDFAGSVDDGVDWALLFLEAWAEMLRTPAFGEDLRRIDAQMRATIAEVVERSMAEQGLVLDLPAETVAEMVIATTHGFGVQHRLDPAHAPAELFAELSGTLLMGLLSRARPA